MRGQKTKHPADMNRLAKSVVDIATGQKNPSSMDIQPKGRAGGLVGGKARAAKLTNAQHTDIAKAAARVRWEKD